MSRIKAGRLLSFALAALLFMHSVVLAYEPQDIIDAAQLTPQQVTYQTTQVEQGSFINEVNHIAHKYYPLTYHLAFEQTGAKFLEFTVTAGAEVKKGDILARFTIDSSQAELTRLKLDLQRTQEQTADGIREREQAIEKKRTELTAASDAYEKEILALSLEKLEIELKQYKYRQQYSIEQKSKAYNKEYTQRTADVLVSPVDGVVSNLTFKKVDDAVLPNETLVTVVSGESILLSVQNGSLDLRYNMPVEIQVGSSPNETYLPGRVVAADDAIPAEKRTGYALIQLDPYDEETYTITDAPKVIAESARLDNVLLIPNKAVTREADKSYVTKLTDGMAQKRYIDPAMNNFWNTWVLAGVEEGETLILN